MLPPRLAWMWSCMEGEIDSRSSDMRYACSSWWRDPSCHNVHPYFNIPICFVWGRVREWTHVLPGYSGPSCACLNHHLLPSRVHERISRKLGLETKLGLEPDTWLWDVCVFSGSSMAVPDLCPKFLFLSYRSSLGTFIINLSMYLRILRLIHVMEDSSQKWIIL